MKKENSLIKPTFSFILFNILILSIVGLAQYLYQINELNKEFKHNIENIIKKEFSNNISSTKGVLTSLSSVYKSINQMNQSEFTVISKDLLSNYDYMKAIGFATILNKDDRSEFLNEVKDRGLFNFNIKTFENKKLVVQKDSFKKYAPIVYIEPANYKYSSFYGFDIYNSNDMSELFKYAAKKDTVKIIDKLETPLGFDMNIFIKATYKGENEKNTDSYRLQNTNGFFIIDVDIEKLLTNIKNRFKDYDIKIRPKEEFVNYTKEKSFKEATYLKKLLYFEKIETTIN